MLVVHLGGALAVWHKELNKPRAVNPDDAMQGSYLGPSYKQESIEKSVIRMWRYI